MSFGAACITIFGGGLLTGVGAVIVVCGIRLMYLALTAERI